MAAPQNNNNNVEMEAAKFLHKLIQESTDEPTKLATKLHVILQHMRSSGKENSMPYQVISRAMETVINRHGLDMEALISSRPPLTSGSQAGDSSFSQIAGTSQQIAVEDNSQKTLNPEQPVKVAAFSGKLLHGSNSAGHDSYQGSANQLNSIKSHGSNAGFSGSYESLDVGNPISMQFSNLYDNQSAATLMHKGPGGKALDHESGFQNVMSSTSKTVQGGIYSNVAALGLLQNESSRDIGKSFASQGSLAGSSMPFKEHHLKQLRAQCLVFLAFRNSLMPKKLHLEIALGNVFRKEDLSSKEYTDQKGKDPSLGPGSSSSGFVSETNLSKEGEKLDRMIDKNDPLSGLHEHSIIPRKFEANMQAFEAKEAQTSTKAAIDPTNIAGLFDMHDSQGNRHSQSLLSSVPTREGWKSHSGMEGDRHMIVPRNANILEKDVMLGAGHEGEDTSELCALPASPKYTTSEKWITDCQKRKVSADYNWAVKKKKTEQKISACVEKLKETVSSSEDISSKTKSVIELKKLELLNLQRRLRNEILNDFFRPTSAEMDRVKSIKKHRIGRRSKQLERHEQKMKEERQKRIRERQKDFFGELEQHRERLEDVFKFRRERLKGFNKYAREFHKRKERLHREKIDRIQREKINLLKINDVEGYLRMVQDAKSDRVKQLLKETEKYLQKLGTKLKEAKVISRCFETDMGVNDGSEFIIENEDETDQAKHYMESNEKYYLMAHSIKETVAEQPTSLVGGKLREYQMNGLRWLLSLYNNHLNGILADEMGLGKTVQVISLLCYLMENKNDRGPFLVVVPSSVLPGWESEINFWAPSINKIVYSGPPEERRRLFKERIVQQKFNVLLTTYEYLMNKHDRPKLCKIHWHYVIIDEGHRIKNASCKLNADLKHYHSSHRLLLTGTPLQNNLEELWALLNFLLPNIFNSSEDFSQWFNKPFESNADNSLEEALLSEEENLLIINRLHQVLRPFVLRRLKHKVENELPEKIERLVRCEASAYQKLLMQRVEDNLGAFGASKSRAVHNSVVELRNICNHPYISQLHTEEVHDFVPKHYLPNIIRFCGKLEMLDRLLPKLKATDHRILLFSTMTRLLDVMEDYLYWKQYKYLRLDGHTSGGDRGALIDQFNKSGSPFFIFLLSIRAGGVGVNLQAADTVIIFDTDWNPQVDLQAQARAHRIGQKKDVLVLRLETVKTVEEQVRASAEHKLGVANQSITAGFFDNNTSAEDRREYLEALLRECKKEEAAPVLNDDALNDIIARSESEIDVFEEIDKKRQEEELVVWERLVSEQGGTSSEVIPPLPSRLVTENELTSFCEAMKAIEVPKPVVVPGIGGKRKGELGNLDVQHYGRGKRAREVRSYEEQWTEDEFEKLCQAEISGSPNRKEESKERELAIVKSESGVVIGSKGPGLPNVKSESGVVIGSEATGLPNIQPLQPTADSTVQQMKDLNTPSKRGRGRPKKNLTGVSPSSVGRPASQGHVTSTAKTVTPAVNPLGIQILPSSEVTTTSPKSNPYDTNVTLAVPPGFQPAASNPPGFQPPVTPGYKSMTTPPPGYQPISAPPGYQQITPPPPGFQPKFSSSPLTASQETDSLVSCSAIPTPGPSSLSTTSIHAGSHSTTTVPASQSKSTPHSNFIASTDVPPGILSSPASPLGPVSMPMLSPTSPNSPSAISPIVTPGRGRGQGRGRGRGQGRGRGRGQINESEVGVPQRRGRKSPNVVLAIPGLRTSSLVGEPETKSLLAPSTDSETTPEQKVSTSAAVNDASNTPVSASPVNFPVNLSHRPDIASPRTPVPIASIATSSVLTNTSETLDAGTLQTLVSDSIGSMSTDVGILSSQTAMPLVTAPIGSHSMSSNPVLNQGRGRGRKVVHGGIEAPRRRRKEDAADTQEQKSNEPVQKRTRVPSGRKTIATRSMLRNEAQKRTDQASITDDRSTHVSSLAEPSVNSASHAKDQPNTSAEIDASTIDGSPSTQWENVVEQKNILVAKESGKKTHDIDITKSKEEMHPQKLPILEVQGEMESKPESLEMGESKTHKKEKLSHVEDSFPQKVESFKLEADHKDRVAARSALEDANTNNKLDVDAAVDELSAENKSEKDDPVIDGGVLEAVEANPTEKSNLPCPGASEVVQAVEKTAVEIVQKPSSPVLLSDTERVDSTTSFEKIAKISQATIKHEKEQVATNPFMEVDDDSNKTSSELAITQVEIWSKSESLEKGDSEPPKEAEKSSFGEDSVSQKAESFKVEVEHKEHVATDPLMEVNDDSNKTSSELAITQVEMGSKSESLEKGDSEPPKEADKSSFGENSVSQKAESFKVEDEHKEHVASNPFMEVDDDSNKTSSDLAITQVEMGSKSESPEKGDSEPLKEAEKSSFGGDSVSQIAESFKVDVEHKEHVATDPFMEVDDDSNKTSSEVEIGSKSESPEKGDSEYPKGEKLSFGEDSVSQKAESFKAEVEHKEQVATDPFMEADVDSNDTSSELAITQGEMGSKSESFEKGDSEPDKEAEKFSFGVDSLSQNSESFKGEVEQEEQVAECSASDDVGKIKIIEVDATIIELSPEMKSEKDEPVIDDRGPLEAMEAYPAEEINVSCHDASEVVPQLEEIEVEIAQEASSPVLQSETERTDTLFENESPSSKMIEKIYPETIEHEKEQVATDTVMEEVDASNETSSELTITQGKMESKSGSPEKVMFEPNKEVEKSSHGEDSLPQSVEHFKEKIEREEQVAECCTSKDAVKNNEWEADAAVIELSAEKKREKEDPAIDDGETLQSLEGKPAEEVPAALHRASEVVPAVDEILFEMNEVEKSSHGAESLPQNVEHFKAEIKHEERVAECIASKDAGKNHKSEADAAVIQLSAEKKSVKEDHAIDDGGTLQAVEGKPAEEVQAALRGTSEVVTAVDEIVVEIARGASSSVLQSELERTDFLFETGRIDSQRTIVHEMEQAAIGSITEDADDSTKTLLEFSITQGGREFKSEFEPHSVTKSSQGEDSLPQKVVHFKEKVEHMGHVIECKAAQDKKMEVDAAINELFTEKKSEKEDHAIDGGTLEASPAEECPVALHEANEVVPAVVEIVKEPLSPVLQNEPERPNSTFETEASSFEMIKKISEGKIEL